MSIYLFKTEDYYGGETRVFLSKVEAEEYRTQFIERTNSRTDAIIEEHKPFPVVHVRRNNGEVDPKPRYLIGTQEAGDNVVVCETDCGDNWPLDVYAVSEVVRN